MSAVSVLMAFAALLIAVLRFNKLWLGALIGIAITLVFNFTLLEDYSPYAPLTNGVIITTELILLVFGAYLFYNTLNQQNQFSKFIHRTQMIPERLDILLLFALFFGSFLEGIAGFGIPAMLIAPLLLSLGFRPLTCIVIPLVANTVPVLFGALGTPIILGLAYNGNEEIIWFTLVINLLPILLLPFIMAMLFEKTEAQKLDWSSLWKRLIVVALIYAIPFISTGLFSVEFPSVVAGIVGMLVFTLLYVPKNIRPKLQLWWTSFWPYAVFILLLIIARFTLRDLNFKPFEMSKSVSLYQPGLIFLIAAIFYNSMQRKAFKEFVTLANSTLIKLRKTAISIALLVLFTQLTQVNLSAITHYILSNADADLIAPVFGLLGSFTTGSATMSNLLFAPAFQDTALFLALLHTGSAMGNAISLQNILMVNAVLNSPNAMWEVIRKTGYWVLIYLMSILTIVLIAGIL